MWDFTVWTRRSIWGFSSLTFLACSLPFIPSLTSCDRQRPGRQKGRRGTHSLLFSFCFFFFHAPSCTLFWQFYLNREPCYTLDVPICTTGCEVYFSSFLSWELAPSKSCFSQSLRLLQIQLVESVKKLSITKKSQKWLIELNFSVLLIYQLLITTLVILYAVYWKKCSKQDAASPRPRQVRWASYFSKENFSTLCSHRIS